VTARLGEHDTSTNSEALHVDVNILKTIEHPYYDKRDGTSDLAVVYLRQSVQLNGNFLIICISNDENQSKVFFRPDFIRPICLPIAEPELTKNFEYDKPYVAGWGVTEENGKAASILQDLEITLFPNAVCANNYEAANKVVTSKQFNNTVLCAGVLAGEKDTCKGDSGGPLMLPYVSVLLKNI
jgi:hypothetical protein